MKLTKSTVLSFILLVIAASMYRVWEGRPFGFAPQLAMAIFGGAVIRDKRLAFVKPFSSSHFTAISSPSFPISLCIAIAYLYFYRYK